MTKIRNLKTIFIALLVISITTITCAFFFQNTFSAPKISSPIIKYRVSETAKDSAITGDLKYYGFIKSEQALKIALIIKGVTKGKEIQRSSIYEISQSMNVWQLADTLLNNGTKIDCNRGCPENSFDPELIPGGDLAPTIKQKYEWVTNYEDCTKSIGHDGGQLSSEQYFERTGIRRCVAPDGREFTQGKEGWSDVPTP